MQTKEELKARIDAKLDETFEDFITRFAQESNNANIEQFKPMMRALFESGFLAGLDEGVTITQDAFHALVRGQ